MLRLKKNASSDDTTTAPASVAPASVSAAKKDLPPATLAGVAVGVLALLGIAAYFMFFRPPAPPPSAPDSSDVPALDANGASTTGVNGVSTPGAVTPPGSTLPAGTTTTSVAPGAMSSAGRSTTGAGATPVPPPVPVVSAAVVRPGPGSPPILAPPSAPVRPLMTPLTPTLEEQLKALWRRGVEAKHSGDYQAARGYWSQALRLRPGHPGFAEAIRKLPPQQGRRVR